jgi:hypothetical protein
LLNYAVWAICALAIIGLGMTNAAWAKGCKSCEPHVIAVYMPHEPLESVMLTPNGYSVILATTLGGEVYIHTCHCVECDSNLPNSTSDGMTCRYKIELGPWWIGPPGDYVEIDPNERRWCAWMMDPNEVWWCENVACTIDVIPAQRLIPCNGN